MSNNFKSLGRIINQINYILDRKQKKESIAVFFCMILNSCLELLGISAIYPFLQIMLNPTKMQEKWYIKWLYDIYPDISVSSVLLASGIALIVIYLLKNIFMIICVYVQTSFAAAFRRTLSTRMLDTYFRRSYQFFLNTNSSEILRGIGGDVDGVYQILLNLFTILAETLTVVVLGVFLLVTDPKMTVAAMALAFICFMAIILGFKGKMKEAGRNARKASALKSKYGYQAINGIKEIMVLDRKDNFVRQYNEAAALEQKTVIVNGVIGACPDRILEGICIGGIIGIVCIRIVSGADLDTFIPVLGTFAMAAFKILPSISKISSRVNALTYHQIALQETYRNLKETYKYEEQKKEYITQEGIVEKKETDAIHFRNELKIQNVRWQYLNAKESVLEHTSLCIRKGESVAFIGASGAGKTTLADVIMGLLQPQEGTVQMDGIDIFAIPHQWARIIGYVPQSVFLIDDTVRNNVAFGLKENEISDAKVWEALEQAQLKDFVQNLPYGLDTIVGERGVKFSGGQRQRIAIARALYENPEILVLDEATSALDNETESAVMESIDALQGHKTLIIVAHRLTTIRNCNKVYEIKDGVAVEKTKEEIFG